MEGPSPRIVKETKTIQTDPVPGITFQPDPNNYKHFFIELNGILSLIQDHQELAMMEANFKQNFFFLMTTPCPPQKSSLTLRCITQTSVSYNSFRQFRKNLPRYSQEKLVSSPSNEISAAFDPKSAC